VTIQTYQPYRVYSVSLKIIMKTNQLCQHISHYSLYHRRVLDWLMCKTNINTLRLRKKVDKTQTTISIKLFPWKLEHFGKILTLVLLSIDSHHWFKGCLGNTSLVPMMTNETLCKCGIQSVNPHKHPVMCQCRAGSGAMLPASDQYWQLMACLQGCGQLYLQVS